jgi:hypothetical protein
LLIDAAARDEFELIMLFELSASGLIWINKAKGRGR